MLRFSPTAWAKLVWFCLKDEVEISGFAITDPGDPLYVIDFATVKQQVDWASIRLDDVAVADFFDRQVDLGRKPENFARIWLHTHPGDSPTPSGVDTETFARVFGRCQWAVLFVLARTGKVYARLRFNVGPGGSMDLPIEIDWLAPFASADQKAWAAEYEANIESRGTTIFQDYLSGPAVDTRLADVPPAEQFGAPGDGLDDLAESVGQDLACLDVSDAETEAWNQLWLVVPDDAIDAAVAKVCAQWGMRADDDWPEVISALDPVKQAEFRKEVEAALIQMGELDLQDAG